MSIYVIYSDALSRVRRYVTASTEEELQRFATRNPPLTGEGATFVADGLSLDEMNAEVSKITGRPTLSDDYAVIEQIPEDKINNIPAYEKIIGKYKMDPTIDVIPGDVLTAQRSLKLQDEVLTREKAEISAAKG